jgi:DNA-binding transcriptional regulator YhcF (GntR family)
MNQMLRVPREETSLRQRTTQTLRTAILDGVFAPGQKLSERELCESLDVSRSCLRESLQHLQAEGLITIVPHRGPEVTDISVQEVRDIYEVRASLEGLASRGFALHASEAQRAALRAKLGELAVPGVASDKVALLAIKNQFYDILIEGCGNLAAHLPVPARAPAADAGRAGCHRGGDRAGRRGKGRAPERRACAKGRPGRAARHGRQGHPGALIRGRTPFSPA